jgi:hypothetical protein
MDRRELLELLAKFALVGNGYANYNLGIVVPNFSDAKRFTKDFNQVLCELPEWIRPEVYKNNIREIEFGNHLRIIMLYSSNCSKSRSFNGIYASSRMTDVELAPHCFTVLQLGGTLNRFADE